MEAQVASSTEVKRYFTPSARIISTLSDVFALVFLAVPLAALVDADISSAAKIGIAAVIGVLMAATVFAWWRTMRMAVITKSSGVEVRNPLKTYRLGWDEIREVEARPMGRHPLVAVFDLLSGESVTALGIRGTGLETKERQRALSAVEEIRADLLRQRA